MVGPRPLPPQRETQSLLSLRLFYFFSYGALGSLFPFLALLLAHRGLSPTEVGAVMVVVPIANLLVPPLWGAVADALRVRLTLLRVAAVGSGVTSLLLLPRLGFVATVAAMAVFSLFRAPLSSLADAESVDRLEGRSAEFSRVRVWGSAGFAVFVVVLGWLEASSKPSLLVTATALVYMLSALCTVPLRRREFEPSGEVRAGIGEVLRRGSVLVFLISTAVYYAGHAMYDVYFGLHVESLGFGDGFVGVAWAVGVGTEVMLLLAAPRFMSRVRADRLLVFCAAVAGVRWLGLSVATSIPALLVLQSLHGVTFGVWYLSLVSFVQSRAGDRLRTTLQSIAMSCIGMGMSVGYLAGGRLFERFTGVGLYRVAAIAAACSMVGYVLSSKLVKNRSAAHHGTQRA